MVPIEVTHAEHEHWRLSPLHFAAYELGAHALQRVGDYIITMRT